MEKKLNEGNMKEVKNVKEVEDISWKNTRPTPYADMFRQEMEKNEAKRIQTMDQLKEEIEKYNRNEIADFNNVNWGKLVKDREFTEEMMTMFQVQAQLYYEDFVKTHNVSNDLLRRMYYDFLGVFMLDWLDKKRQGEVFPELFEN